MFQPSIDPDDIAGYEGERSLRSWWAFPLAARTGTIRRSHPVIDREEQCMRLFVIRHGESEYNLRGLCNDDPHRPVHLTEKGRAQAVAAARRLADSGISIVYSSRLPRAMETAAIIARACGTGVVPDARLNDIRTGFDGRPVEEYFAAIAHDRLRGRVDGAESLLDYKGRVAPFVDELRHLPPPWPVAVVAHEETLRVFQALLGGLPDEEMPSLQFDNGEILLFDDPPLSLQGGGSSDARFSLAAHAAIIE